MLAVDSKIRQIWNLVICLLSVSSVLLIPLSLVYHIMPPAVALAFSLVLSAAYLADIGLEFNTSYRLVGKVVAGRLAVSRHYLRQGFLPDLIAAFPWYFVVLAGLVPPSSYFTLLALIPLIKLVKANRLLYSMAEEKVNPAILRLVLVVFWILIADHLISCAWIIISGNPDGLAPFDRYVRALYWATTTITTIGYGDITPDGTTQTLFVILIEFFGAAMYGLVIGNIAGLIANIDVAKTQYKEKLEKVNAFFKFKSIPLEVKRKIDDYYAYLWETRRGYNELAILEDLPSALKETVALSLNQDIIAKVPIFAAADPNLIRDIIVKLQPAVFTPGDYVMRAGEYGDEMYFISQGSVDVLSADEATKYNTLAAGSFFGEMALLLSTTRTATVRANEYCDLYVLDKATFEAVAGRYPGFQGSIKKMAEERRLAIEAAKRRQEIEAAKKK